eukprot:1008876-Pyramimonas_sp.AAC.1
MSRPVSMFKGSAHCACYARRGAASFDNCSVAPSRGRLLRALAASSSYGGIARRGEQTAEGQLRVYRGRQGRDQRVP